MEIAEHFIASNEIADYEIFICGNEDLQMNMDMDVVIDVEFDLHVADVLEDQHVTTDVDWDVADLLVVDMVEGLHVANDVDLGLHVADLAFEFRDVSDMDFMLFDNFTIASCDQLQELLVKHYVHFVPESEHADWFVEIHMILIFVWMTRRWLIMRFALLSLIDWKPLVKMKMGANISFGIKVWDTFLFTLEV